MRRLQSLAGLLGTAVFTATITAQSVVAPTANWTMNGGVLLNSLARHLTRTVQQGIAASELTGIPFGAEIVGISVRAGTTTSNPAMWPPAAATWANYDITLAEAAVPISQFTTTFATNMKNPVQVRKGSFTVPAGWLTNNGLPGPNTFGTVYFGFQRPYVYQGGDLVVFVTHDGNNSGTSLFLDCVASSPTAHGLTSYATTYQATTATVASTNFNVMRIHYGRGPAGVAGSGGLAPLLILSNNLVSPTPVPGSFNLAVTNGFGGASGILLVSPATLGAPFPLPNGTNLLVNPALLTTIPLNLSGSGPGAGRWDLKFSLPGGVAGNIAFQAAIFDPGAPSGYVGTNAVLLAIGP